MEPIDSKVAELQGPRRLVFRTQQLGPELRPGELFARTLATAISPGTELAAFTGARPLRPGNPYPRLVGYCNVARVCEVGKQVAGIEVGDRIYTHQSHRSAFVCTRGDVLAVVPEAVDSVAASTTYLYHLGYDALLRGSCLAGSTVAVLGLGTLGLATVAMARVAGARVVAVTGQRERVDLARELGAERVLFKNAGSKDAGVDANEAFAGTGIDIVVTTSSSWSDWRVALALPRRRGKIVVLGFPGRDGSVPDFNPLDSQFFYDRQLSISACGLTASIEAAPEDLRFTLQRNCAYILSLIEKGSLDPTRIVTEVRNWSELDAVYRRLEQRDPARVTTVLEWQ